MTTQSLDDSTTEGSPVEKQWYRRENVVRFIKFGLVGGLGVVVNWLFFEIGYYVFASLAGRAPVLIGYGLGLVVSIFTNFVLNDIWTWADREKGGIRHWFHRLGKYYVAASVAGAVQFGVSWASLEILWSKLDVMFPGWQMPVVWSGVEIPAFDLGPRLGLLTGIACGMVINFLASHLWAFQDAETN